MKFVTIITVFLALVVIMVQATPVQLNEGNVYETEGLTKRKLGSNIVTLGVRFQDQYAQKVIKLKAINKQYRENFASFDKEAPLAAKADNLTEIPTFLLTWNAKYEELVGDLETTTQKLDQRVEKLKKLLKQ